MDRIERLKLGYRSSLNFKALPRWPLEKEKYVNDILVLGGGAWGTAIANLLADNTKKIIYLWSFEKEVARTINSTSINKKYLPAKKINKNILASSYLPDISINIIFIVIPSQFIYDFLRSLKVF